MILCLSLPKGVMYLNAAQDLTPWRGFHRLNHARNCTDASPGTDFRADLSYCLPGVPAQPAAQVEKEAPVEWLFVQWADGNFGPGCKTPRIGHV